jgi:lipopolysaccharide export system protein LptA
LLWVYSRWLVAVVVGAVFFPILGWGEDQKTTTVITSNTMTASSQKNKAIFRENVKMVQEELVVHSDIMIVYFKEKTAPAPSPVGQLPSENSKKEIRVIEAKGHVKITKGESRATCTRALYDKQEERIILLGSPVVWQEGTRISGQKITMFLKENRSIVEGGTRVTIEERAEN